MTECHIWLVAGFFCYLLVRCCSSHTNGPQPPPGLLIQIQLPLQPRASLLMTSSNRPNSPQRTPLVQTTQQRYRQTAGPSRTSMLPQVLWSPMIHLFPQSRCFCLVQVYPKSTISHHLLTHMFFLGSVLFITQLRCFTKIKGKKRVNLKFSVN